MSWAQRWVRAIESPRLLVVGGASLDRIHVNGVPVSTPGGAGLYTALAAVRAGVEVTMLAPVPDPMPPELARATELVHWIGPSVAVDDLPRFEIAYDEDGAVTLFREHLGAEPDMSPALLDSIGDLPAAAYCVPFMDARLQRDFVDALRARGCVTVAATYGKAVRVDTDLVRDTLAVADLAFCNTDEEQVLFGASTSPPATGHLRFVTRGGRGATVFQGDHRTDVAGQQVRVVDPTGAGDTFCGTAVARILLGDHPVEAARRANAAAAEMVTAVGPTALWQTVPSPLAPIDERVVVDHEAVERVATLIARSDDATAFDFTGDLFPAVGHPATVAWFTAATLQQFGFWYLDDGRWSGSMIATIGGTPRKGSDYLWAMYRRWLDADAEAMRAATQANVTADVWHAVAVDDDGNDPFPDPATCIDLAAAHGRTLLELGLSADEMVAVAAASTSPMRALLVLLDHVAGYREDPLRKKAALLAVILRQRPEVFLPVRDDDAPPIVDYHVQRSCLRTGLIRVTDDRLRAQLVERRELSSDDEWAVRRAAFDAVQRVVDRSGRTMGAVDWFLFQMRHRCPEASTPTCAECPADPACAHSIELFQPVRRTTAY